MRYVPAPVPKEYDKNKLIVRDIPDNVDEEFLSTLVESRLGLEYMKRTLLWTLETNVQL